MQIGFKNDKHEHHVMIQVTPKYINILGNRDLNLNEKYYKYIRYTYGNWMFMIHKSTFQQFHTKKKKKLYEMTEKMHIL